MVREITSQRAPVFKETEEGRTNTCGQKKGVIMITTIIMIMNIIVIMIILIMIIIIMTIQSNLFSRDPTVLSKSAIAENASCVSAASLLAQYYISVIWDDQYQNPKMDNKDHLVASLQPPFLTLVMVMTTMMSSLMMMNIVFNS